MPSITKFPWPRTLHSQALWAVLLIALLALGNVLIIQLLLRQSDDLAATLNLAGKMRMFSQRIALETLAAHQQANSGLSPATREQYASFETIYGALRNGGDAYGLQVRALEQRHQPALQALHDDWQRYRQAIDALDQAPADARLEVVQVMAASQRLLGQTETLMDGLVLHADDMQRGALAGSLALFALDVLLLVVAYRLIAQRVLSPIRALTRQCRELAQGRYDARAQLTTNDELGELAQALDRSASQITTLLQDVAQERAAVAQVQAMFDGLADNSVAGVYLLDESIHIIYANEQLARILGYEREVLSNHFPMERLFAPATYALVRESIQDRLQGRVHSSRYERCALRADGAEIAIEVFGSAMTLHGRPAVIGMMIDITERKRAELSVRRAALVYQHTSEAMVVTDPQGVVLDANPSFTAITGYEAREVIGRRMNLLSSGQHDRAFYQAMWATLHETGGWSGDIVNRQKNGEEFIVRLTISTSYNEDGSISSHIGLFADVTEKRRREASIWHQAHFDHLTQLPNRQMFQQNLQLSMDGARASGQPFALVFLDLDLFKEVNDTFGHDEGDELLRQVARRLQACVRSTDQVARLGGDEFTLILQHLKHLDDVRPICRKVLHSVAQPYQLKTNTVRISVSAGVTFFPQDGLDGVALLKHADLAMYAAKDKGRNQFCEFAPAMEQEAQERRLLLRDLQQALDENEFTLHYQPIVDMRSMRTVKAEALLRWHNGVRGQVSPARFIPLAEESGLISPLGDWVFQEAARQLVAWRAELDPEFQVSVNVSPVQLHSNKQQAQTWLQHLRELELPTGALVMELTESVLMESDQETNAKLQALQEAGIQLALDDFGTGYSSLSYLKRLDIDYLKIDRSFVNQLTPGSEDNVLCEAIIVMAHQLGIRVVAEGVETREQHDILRAAGCDYGQGYWYCRPVSAEDFGTRLRDERARQADTHEPLAMAVDI